MSACTRYDHNQKPIELSLTEVREIIRILQTSLVRGEMTSTSAQILRFATEKEGTARAAQDDRIWLIEKARAVWVERHRRSQFLNRAMFGEPGWDVLIGLYIADFEGVRQTVGRLVSMAGAPHTTALRWIDYLEKERLILREPHPADRRVVYVTLLGKGREIMDAYFADLPERRRSTTDIRPKIASSN